MERLCLAQGLTVLLPGPALLEGKKVVSLKSLYRQFLLLLFLVSSNFWILMASLTDKIQNCTASWDEHDKDCGE